MTQKILRKGTFTEEEMFNLFGTEGAIHRYQSGKCSRYDLKQTLKRASLYCVFKNIRNKRYTITHVYKNPAPENLDSMRSGIYKYLIPTIIEKLLHSDDACICVSMYGWMRQVNLLNKNYSSMSYLRGHMCKILSQELERSIPREIVAHFFDSSTDKAKYYINHALDLLLKGDVIKFKKVGVATRKKLTLESGSKASIYTSQTELTPDEIIYIQKLRDDIMQTYGIDNTHDFYFKKSNKDARNTFNAILFEEKQIASIQMLLCISLTDKTGAAARHLLKQFDKKKYSKFHVELNKEFANRIMQSAKNETEELVFKKLCEICIDLHTKENAGLSEFLKKIHRTETEAYSNESFQL